MNRVSGGALLLLPVLFACSEIESPMAVVPDDEAATADTANIAGARVGVGPVAVSLDSLTQVAGDWSFHFLPPSGPVGGDVSGFDASLTEFLVVEICAGQPDCADPMRMDANGRGSERLQLHPRKSYYKVKWHHIMPGTRYYVRVLAADLELAAITSEAPRVGRNNKGRGYSAYLKFRIDSHPVIRTRVMAEAGASATELAGVLASEFGLGARDVAELLFRESYSATDAGFALQTTFGTGAEENAGIQNEVGWQVQQTGQMVRNVYNLGDHLAAKTLKAADFTAEQVAEVLNAVYGLGDAGTAAVLAAVDFTATEVGSVLKDVFRQTGEGTVLILREVGYTTIQIAGVLSSTFGQTADQVGQTLSDVGYTANQVADVLRDAFGWSASQAATFLGDVLGYSQGVVEGALDFAGYAESEVRGAIEDFFGEVGDVFCGIFGC